MAKAKPNHDDDDVETVKGFTSGIVNSFFYIITVAAAALASWAITNSMRTAEALAEIRGEIKLLQNQMIEGRKALDERQDASLHKHWRLHSWARDEIAELRKACNLPTSRWPDLDEGR